MACSLYVVLPLLLTVESLRTSLPNKILVEGAKPDHVNAPCAWIELPYVHTHHATHLIGLDLCD